MNPFLIIPVWLAGAGLFTWALFRRDKASAMAGRRRIPERTLHLCALAGGFLGALSAMYLSRPRHKTQKPGFVAIEWSITAGYLLLGIATWWLLIPR